MRRLLLIIALVFGSGAIIYFFRQFKRAHTPVPEIMNAVPRNAALIVESEDLRPIWHELSNTNLIWQDLNQAQNFRLIDRSALLLDSLLDHDDTLANLVNNHRILVSAHPSGARKYNFLFTTALPFGAEPADVAQHIHRLLPKGTDFSQKDYDNVVIYTAQFTKDYTIHFAFPKDIMVLSFSPILVEDAIRQTKSGISLAGSGEIKQLRSTTNVNSDAEVYVNLQNLSKLLAPQLSDEAQNTQFFKTPLSSWAAYDFYLKPNAILLTGFALRSDSMENFLSAFDHQKPGPITLTQYMPASTAYYIDFSWSNFSAFQKDYNDFLDKGSHLYNHKEARKKQEDYCQCNLKDLGLSWLGNEAAALVTEPTSTEYDQNKFLIFSTANPDAAREKLSKLENALIEASKKKPDTAYYRGYHISQLLSHNLYGALLTPVFGNMKDPYFTEVGDAVVFANSLNALRIYINSWLAKNTLANDPSYKAYAENMDRTSNVTLYSSLARSPFLYQHLLRPDLAEDLSKKTDLLRKFEAASFQFSHHKDNLFYSQVYFKHNPAYKKETTSLWEAQLGGALYGDPHVTINHYTQAREIFAEDQNFKTYLVSNTGKVLWSRQLEEPIDGPVDQVDLYKNKKLQMVFTTPTAFWCMDRNGHDVDGYPIKIRGGASAPAGIFDYDNTRDYRFLVPTNNRKLLMYDNSGKPVKGWQAGETRALVTHQPRHLRIKNKDYILVVDKMGYVYLLDRQGDIRHPMKQQASGISSQPFAVTLGNRISDTYMLYVDTLGNVEKLRFDGTPAERMTIAGSTDSKITIRDINNDGKREILEAKGDQLTVYDQDGSTLFSHKFEDDILGAPQFFLFPNKTCRIGITIPGKDMVYLLDNQGNVVQGTPLYGGSRIAISDINRDGDYNLITGSKDGSLYAYGLK